MRSTRARPFVIPNPWDAGSARVIRGARLQGARHHQLGLRVHARPARRQRHARRDRRAHARARPRRPACPSRSTWRTATGPNPEDAATAITRAAEAGAVGGSIEDWDPRRRAVRARPRGRAGRRRGRGGAEPRLPVHAHRARREPHPRQPGPRRHDRAAPGLRARRRRRALRARACAARRDPDASATRVSKPVNVLGAAGPVHAPRSPRRAAQRISVGGAADVGRGRRDGDRRRADPRQAATCPCWRAPCTSRSGSATDAALRRLPARGQPRRPAQGRQRRAALLLRGRRPRGRADVPDQRQRRVRRRAASRAAS